MESGLLVTIDGVQYARHYNDGPDWPHPDCEWEAERAFRDAFVAAAREVAEWAFPDADQIEAAWEARRKIRDKASVVVTSAELFNDPKWDEYDPPGTHFVYRIGHEVEASRARGKHHAMEICRQDWRELASLGFGDNEEIRHLFNRPWLDAVVTWADEPIDSGWAPPRPLDQFSPVQWNAILSKQKGIERIFDSIEDAESHLRSQFGSWDGRWKCRDESNAVIGHVYDWQARYTHVARPLVQRGDRWGCHDKNLSRAMTTVPSEE
jgi:hypothetical protein